MHVAGIIASRLCWGQIRRGTSPSAVVASRSFSRVHIDRRLEIWHHAAEVHRQRTDESFDRLSSLHGPKITLTLPDGTQQQFDRGQITPLDVARQYFKDDYKKLIIAQLDGSIPWDMTRALERSARLEFISYDDNDNGSDWAKHVFWHSSAHVIGAALESVYGDNLLLSDGPALKDGGFFYEFLLWKSEYSMRDELQASMALPHTVRTDRLLSQPERIQFVSEGDIPRIKKTIDVIISKKYAFERIEVDLTTAKDMFRDNPFKLHFLDRASQQAEAAPGDRRVTLYRCGDMVDLCRGPHVVHTAQLRAFRISKVSSAYWVTQHEVVRSGGPQPPPPLLNRMYGISFPTADRLKAHERFLTEAAKRDHRAIGREQKLFMMHHWTPGAVFFLPHGQRLINRLVDLIQAKYREYGFEQVSTPLVFKRALWETSGHWANYKDDMFAVTNATAARSANPEGGVSAEAEAEFGLKPMNCPGHCLVFASQPHSYRELPVRYAEFSPLHRNEASGALAGLTRVRQFHQDDGHIFCTIDQVQSEIRSSLRFVHDVYTIFGFPKYELTLSTRPRDSFIGSVDEWDRAERALRDALNENGHPWTVNEGDGAFYGPKIDIRVQDALGRKHQTATIQLDFQLPQRFELRYADSSGRAITPVMIHRAILGSVERMLAILAEHWAGKWPFWCNPRQALVVPIGQSNPEIMDYARRVARELSHPGISMEGNWREDASKHRFYVDLDESGQSLNKAIRTAQLSRYSFALVVGEKEAATGTVNVRQRDGKQLGSMKLGEVKGMFVSMQTNYQ
ncbi:hypothetical protein EV182_001951 [Spiromyces aspiralis]|uniref:Uncharacterized protein n=1 Tax=Spiromyces aspiralis TaxID=68401 RepID=A0ACC1HH80_9FUNG|nr:hypothetical protein EV182_001951 [Spiromyces aspiralis]